MRSAEYIVPITPKKLKRILDYLMAFYVDSRDWKNEKNYNTYAKECYRFYRGIPIKKPAGFSHQSNYWRPLTYSAVETITPRIMSGLFSTDPFVRYLGISDEDQEAATKLSKLTVHKLLYEVPFLLQMAKAIKNSLVYSFCCIYSPWLSLQKTRYARDMMDNAKRIAIKQTVIDSVWCSAKPIWDVYPQAEVESIDSTECDGTIIREMVTPSQLWQRALKTDSPYIIEQVEKILSNISSISYPSEDDEHYKELDQLIGFGRSDRRKKIELLHYWGTYDLFSDDRPEISDSEVWICIANRTQVVLCIPNPFDSQERPLTELRPVPNTHGLLGISIPEAGRDTQLEANDNMNLRLDQIAFIANKVVKVKRNTDIYEKLQGGDLIVYPGASIPVDDMDDIQELAFSSIDPALYIEDKILSDEFDKTHGIYDLSYGKGDSRARTATGTSMIIQQSNYRFDFMLKNITANMLPLMQKIGYYNQQYALSNEPKELNMVDLLYPTKRTNFKWARKDIQCSFQALLLGSSTRGDKSYHFALLQSLKQLLANDPNINQEELDRQLLEEAELKNLDLLLQKMPPSTPNAAADTGMSGIVGGMSGLGGPTENKANLDNQVIAIQKDKIV